MTQAQEDAMSNQLLSIGNEIVAELQEDVVPYLQTVPVCAVCCCARVCSLVLTVDAGSQHFQGHNLGALACAVICPLIFVIVGFRCVRCTRAPLLSI